MKKIKKTLTTLIILIMVSLISTYLNDAIKKYYASQIPSYDISSIPSYDGNSYVIINDNIPDFKEDDYLSEAFESYSDLDLLGRAGVAFAHINYEMMPTTERTSIGTIKPSGWKTVKYDFVDGKYLYNRCHLIAYQLSGENANEKNLITCTRQMNTKGMLEFENKVANYIKNTNNDILYRVTPIYEGTNLVAMGVQIEASSIKDHCKDICFNVFVYNVQDGVSIDYTNGDSSLTN
ncbi:MAG: DNA/RNA non-specific endonuclease [Bacilli bacterium]|nr:DNA/RNA non-specific endonuclease [Bacilli bacterium]